jgi:hypothetical protein
VDVPASESVPQDRVHLAAEYRRLVTERDQLGAEHRRALVQSADRISAAEAPLRSAREEHQALELQSATSQMAVESAIGGVVRELKDTASPAIAVFIQNLQALRRRVYDARGSVEFRKCEPEGPHKPLDVVTNTDAVTAALECIETLVTAADDLTTLAVSDAELEGRLRALRDTAPAVPPRNILYRY